MVRGAWFRNNTLASTVERRRKDKGGEDRGREEKGGEEKRREERRTEERRRREQERKAAMSSKCSLNISELE